MTRQLVYLETTVVSYLTAWPSRDVVRVAHQQVTRDWWQQRDRFELFVSEAVLREAGAGDPAAAADRLAALKGLPILATTLVAADLAKRLLQDHALPGVAAADALHVAVAATNGMHYLLTWNCRHIANAVTRRKIEESCRRAGLVPPVICTPEELIEE
jgi:predicted nucleic acid-binding protein